MLKVKFWLHLARSPAVVSNNGKFHQQMVTHQFPAFFRCFSVNNFSWFGNDERRSIIKNREVSSVSNVTGTKIEGIPAPLQPSVFKQVFTFS
jgi:hypothetical protein